MRIFVDTNVWLSGFMGRGVCADLLAAWTEADVTLLLDERVRAELFRIARTKFRASARQRALIDDFLGKAGVAVVSAARKPTAGIPDADDAWIIAAALNAGADWFVTGDRALLDLGQVAGLPIVSPRAAYLRLRGLG